MIRLKYALAGLILATVLAPVSTMAQGVPHVRVGTLDCAIAPGIGFVIGSQKSASCLYTSANGRQEFYAGRVNTLGLDVGVTTGGRMIWAVYAPTTRRHAALAGFYGGAGAEATVGAGVGANVLIGGSDRTVSLQPLSVKAQRGLNVAAGASSLELQPARRQYGSVQ